MPDDWESGKPVGRSRLLHSCAPGFILRGMTLISVDASLCKRCGACVDVCPAFIIAMKETGPEAVFPKGCFACGHCVAVCPHGALDNERAPRAAQAPFERFPVVDPETAERFLRSRRSIRSYRPEPAPRALVERLLGVARQAPTGANSQGISFIVLDKPEQLRGVVETTVAWMEQEAERDTAMGRFYGPLTVAYRRYGKDIILRGAPGLVVTHADPENRMAVGNTHAIIAYAELFATSLGLGSCWAGFVTMAAVAGHQPLLDIIRPPSGRMVTGGFMLGYPRHLYHRLVERNPLQVEWR